MPELIDVFTKVELDDLFNCLLIWKSELERPPHAKNHIILEIVAIKSNHDSIKRRTGIEVGLMRTTISSPAFALQ